MAGWLTLMLVVAVAVLGGLGTIAFEKSPRIVGLGSIFLLFFVPSAIVRSHFAHPSRGTAVSPRSRATKYSAKMPRIVFSRRSEALQRQKSRSCWVNARPDA